VSGMTMFELSYRFVEPLLPPLYGIVRRRLLSLLQASQPQRPDILDVGGRKSHYTVSLPARIVISELPRRTAIQDQLNLGLTNEMVAGTLARRSNIDGIVFDDMTQSRIEDASFDYVLAVEVLEHVERDRDFVRNIHRVLRPGGVFLMTTPNGDAFPIPHNADHKRHYTCNALKQLLGELFPRAVVDYAIVDGKARKLGLRSWSPKRPMRTAGSMAGNLVNLLQSSGPNIRDRAFGTRHLIATGYKAY
jgi:SAM-dependent methyltransferase